MDELMISGRRHAASIRVAKQYGYHSDYLGQLIRGGKVKGQKVGRAWYVDVESLAIYLGKEIPPTPAALETAMPPIEEKQEKEVKVIPVAPAIKETLPKEEEKIVVVAMVEPEPIREEKEVLVKIVKKEMEEVVKQEPVSAPKIEEEKSHHIPIVVHSRESAKTGGLTYLSEDEPLLPEIRKQRNVSRKLDIEVEALTVAEESQKETSKEEVPVRAGYGTQAFALAMVGVLVLALVTAGSSLFVYNLSVGPTQSASVQFSMPR